MRQYLAAFFSFNVIQATQMLLPLLALPWLARVLGSEAFGLLMYMSLISVIIGMVMEWGFTLGAARDVAVCRGSLKAQMTVLGEVLAAKFLLVIVCSLACLCLFPFLPHAPANPGAYAGAVLAGISRGINPTWFFQATGQGMTRLACWDMASGVLALLLTFVCVHAAGDWPRYLFLQAACKSLAYILLTIPLAKAHCIVFSAPAALRALARYKMLFAGVLAAIVYSSGTQLVLGFFLPAGQMGMLVASNKIAQSVVSLCNPLFQTIFPEICTLRDADTNKALRLSRITLFGTAAATFCAGAAVFFAAPFVIRLALGEGYAEAVPILQLMSFFIPVLACNIVLGMQILVPIGREKALTVTQIVTAVASLPAAAVLGRFWGITGGACLPLLVEGCIFLALAVTVWRCRAAVFFLQKQEAK
jgi:PST family polysaccharide transporter